MREPIGLIAGNRELPKLVAAKARRAGRPLYVAAVIGEADPALESLAEGFQWVKLGHLTALVNFFKNSGVRKVTMIGGISREIIFNYEPDEMALEILEQLPDFNTDRILRAVAGKMEECGLDLVSAAELLPELIPSPGLLTECAPDSALLRDLKLAWRLAKELGRLDVGQCVVVGDHIALALEGADGTDATVRRGGALALGPAAVAKVAKPGQDLRLDPPVLGPDSIRVMAASNIGALVVEAGRVLMLDLEAMADLADRAGLALLAWTEREARD